eukprot:symbB.v1.2.040819.t1/scaffold7561.1/size10596/1
MNPVQWDPYQCSEEDIMETEMDQPESFVAITLDVAPQNYGKLWVSTELQLGPLLQIWGARFIPQNLQSDESFEHTIDYAQDVCKATLIPYIDADCQMNGLVIDEPTILIVDKTPEIPSDSISDEGNSAIALKMPYGTTWQQMLERYPYLQDYCFDDFGCIPKDFKPDNHMRIATFMPEITPVILTTELIQAMDETRVECHMLPRADNMVIVLYGSPTALPEIVKLWQNACNETWQGKHHRKIYVQIVALNEWRLIFAPSGTGFATPSHLLPRIVALRLFQTLIASLQQEKGDIMIRWKIDGRHIADLKINEQFSFAIVLQFLKHAFFLRSHGLTPSIVAAGKRVCDAMTGKDLKTKQIEDLRHITAHITMPIFGGAGSKHDHKQNIMTSLATMSLNAGIQLQDVPTVVQTMTSQIGIPRLTHMIYMEDPEVKVEHFLQFCQACGIETPKNKKQVLKRQTKAQKTQQDKQHQAMRNIDVGQYSLRHGFFCDENGSFVNINQVFSPCTAGITMLHPQEAEKWLTNDSVLMPEPIAIFVVGDIELEVTKRISKIVAPAINRDGNQVLLGGYLIQLGEQSVMTTSQEGHIQTRDVQLCAFTMWKTDFSVEDWNHIISSPVRFARQLLETDGHQHCIRTPFGRAFRDGDKPCSPEKAVSVQFHSEVWVQDLRKILRRSGFNGLFITPKETGGKPTAKWKPIWTDIPKTTLEAKFVAHPATAGFIRGRKSTGIRVEAAAFQELWSIIKPDVPPPESIPDGKLWKIQPLPFGVDKDIINEWASNVKWEAHAVRPLGAKAWILSSLVPPPDGILTFNHHPLLVKPLKPRHTDTPLGLVAGPKSQGSNEAPSATAKASNVFRSGDAFLDPWNGYNKKDDNKTAGPTSQYFQHHDKRLDALEKKVEQICEANTQNNAETTQRFTALEDKMHQQFQDTKNAFTSLRADFETTLTQAMQRQDSQIASSMDEIKQLLLRRDKRKADGQDMDD